MSADDMTSAQNAIPDVPALTPDNFINRELSNIDFQYRVLEPARDTSLPLLERLKFIAIVGNNLDEFFMVRVAGYLQRVNLGIARARPDGYTPSQLLTEIRLRVGELFRQQRDLKQQILKELEQHDVYVTRMVNLDNAAYEAARAYFAAEVFPVLTPLAVDHARPFPFISNLSLNLGVYLHRDDDEEEYEFVRIKVPGVLPRIVNMREVMRKYSTQTQPMKHDVLVWLEDLIAANLDQLFPGMHIIETHPFRVLRNADIDYEHEMEDEFLDVRSIIEQGLRERKFGPVVRLSVPDSISKRMLDRLIDELNVDPDRDVYLIKGALGTASLFEMMRLDRPDLKLPAHVGRLPEILTPAPGRNIFDTIRQGDIMLHHPYDSFSPVEEFFRSAARDPDVLAIKSTLYRVGSNSSVVDALLEARDNDKQVSALVELKARFDEENNLEWARALELKGVHVIYGVEELPVKTHAKISLVVRRESDGVRRYVHLGTGNYNASTARLYTDIGLFTCHPEIAEDASRLFNRLTGYAPATSYDRLLVAPEYLLDSLIELINNEIEAAVSGKPARIIMKMNQLEEDVIIQKLYQASQAGVQIDLIVRGLCCLCPGLPGLSDNIRVISIIGRFLEHHRIYYFQNAPEDHRVYMGSADVMRRNLYNRVEVVFPILEARLQRRTLRILQTLLKDNVGAWELQPDATFIKRQPENETERRSAQELFMRDSSGLDELP